MIPVAIASFSLLVVVTYLIVRPFVAPLSYTQEATLEQLRADRDRLRAQLRELEMDFETGKMAPEEYEKFRARRLQQIEATTRAIREAEPIDGEGAVEAPAAETPPMAGEDLDRLLEQRIEARKH